MKRAILAAVFAFASPALGVAQDSVAASGRHAAVAHVLSAFVEHERATKGIPAISVALIDGRRVVWARGFGWADSAAGVRATAGSVYRVGSVSKLFTEIGVMQLVEQRALDLDAPIQRYLPDFKPTNPFGGEITLRELGAHRSGLTREPPVGNYFDNSAPSLAATIASLNSTTLESKPGTRTTYSNAGVAVSGYVLERARGEAFTQYIKRGVLEPLGLEQSAFELQPSMRPKLVKGLMWTMDGRAFAAPTFALGVGPSANLYSTALDLGRFVEILLGHGSTPEGRRVLPEATLNAMWTPQLVPPGTRHGFGIGFDVGEIEGRRTVGHAGAIYGFASSLIALPDDSLGVVVMSALDATNAVTERIAHSAIRLLLDARRGQALAAIDTTGPMSRERALSMMGRYESSKATVDLDEFDGRSLLTPARGGTRGTVRVLGNGGLIVDDELAYGPPVRVLTADRIVVGNDTLTRRVAPEARVVPVVTPKPPAAPTEFEPLIGEYGEDYNVLYIREKDGKLNAVIEWFLEYPLERVSRDVYRTPPFGLYASQDITFKRDARGLPASLNVGYVSFKRRPLPGDDDRVSFRITPVRPPAELRREALSSSPPAESRPMRQPDLVELRSLDPSIKYDIRYATSNNFMGVPFYTSAHAFLQRPAAEAVVRAAAALRKLGYGLLIHDAYRPWYVTKMFWDGTPPDKHMFVADPSQGSRHNRGCAVDLTLYDLNTGAPIRMTGGYDEMSDRSYPLYPGGTSSQRWHRDLLRHAMEAQGFRVIDTEWWHFDYQDWRSYPIGNVTFERLGR